MIDSRYNISFPTETVVPVRVPVTQAIEMTRLVALAPRATPSLSQSDAERALLFAGARPKEELLQRYLRSEDRFQSAFPKLYPTADSLTAKEEAERASLLTKRTSTVERSAAKASPKATPIYRSNVQNSLFTDKIKALVDQLFF